MLVSKTNCTNTYELYSFYLFCFLPGTSLAPIVSAIGSRPNNGEGTRSEHRNEPGSGDSGSTRVLPVRNAVSATLPSHTPGVGIAGSTQTGSGVSTSQPPHDSAPFSSVLAEIHSRLRNSVGNMQGNNTVPSGGYQIVISFYI